MTNISKDQTVRYVLTLIDDMLQVQVENKKSKLKVRYMQISFQFILKEDRSRVDIFWSYAKKQKQSVWAPFLQMLTRNDGFIINQVLNFVTNSYCSFEVLQCVPMQVSRIIAKLACWSPELMDGPDLMYYLTWLKDQLRLPVFLRKLFSFILLLQYEKPLRETNTSKLTPDVCK